MRLREVRVGVMEEEDAATCRTGTGVHLRASVRPVTFHKHGTGCAGDWSRPVVIRRIRDNDFVEPGKRAELCKRRLERN